MTASANVISNKIYTFDSNKIKAFTISLFVHISLLATFLELNSNVLVEPLAKENNRVVVSLVSFNEKVIAQPKPVPKSKKTPTKPFKAKPIVKTKKTIQEKQMPQKEAIVKTEPLISPEALTPPVSKTPIINQALAKAEQKPSVKQKEEPIPATTLGKIRSLIQNSLVYPAIARRMKLEGVVVVSFVLTKDGQIESANVLTPSGSRTLDAKALKTVLALSGEYPRLSKKMDLQIPISFSLQNS